MDFTSLIGMSLVCVMGAMSPGPSLAVVLRNTISGGRTQGVMTGIGHGIGFGIYAFIAVMGLSALLLADERIFNLLQWAGAGVLIWLAYNMLTYTPSGPVKSNPDRFVMALVAGIIDTTWYVLVAAVLAGTSLIDQLRANAILIDRSIGTVLLMLAVLLVAKTLGLDIS